MTEEQIKQIEKEIADGTRPLDDCWYLADEVFRNRMNGLLCTKVSLVRPECFVFDDVENEDQEFCDPVIL